VVARGGWVDLYCRMMYALGVGAGRAVMEDRLCVEMDLDVDAGLADLRDRWKFHVVVPVLQVVVQMEVKVYENGSATESVRVQAQV
jgi:hypothetical protein